MVDTRKSAEVRLEDCPCPLGCERRDELVLTGRDWLHQLPGEFQVVRCGICGLMRTNPRPTVESIAYYYPGGYHAHATVQTGLMYARAMYLAHWLLNMERLPPVRSGRRMLEFGCGSGKFLGRMHRLGWEVEGIEVAAGPAQEARAQGFRVQIAALEGAQDPAYRYDLVVGWMVLEHLHDPVKSLRKLWQWTEPGGWLVVSVPNAASVEFQVFKDRWYALQVPTHLYHFTPRTLKSLLQTSGWQVERVLHQRTIANQIASLAYVLQDSRYANSLRHLTEALLGCRSSPLASLLTYPLGFALALFGQTGRITVWATKAQG